MTNVMYRAEHRNLLTQLPRCFFFLLGTLQTYVICDSLRSSSRRIKGIPDSFTIRSWYFEKRRRACVHKRVATWKDGQTDRRTSHTRQTKTAPRCYETCKSATEEMTRDNAYTISRHSLHIHIVLWHSRLLQYIRKL